MKSLIEIYKQNSGYKNCYIVYDILEVNSDGDPQYVWSDIKQAIQECKNDEYHDGTTLTYENFIKRLLAFDEYSKEIEEGNDWIDYYIDIIYEDTVIDFVAYNKVNYDKKIECFKERYVINPNNEGNCIDDFLKRGIEPCLDNINQLKDSIEKRLPERQMSVEYHKTWCYEKDFAQISLIKKQAEKIIENCEKHLERISEFYTKLS